MQRCVDCGAQLQPEARYCPTCGKGMDSDTSSVATEVYHTEQEKLLNRSANPSHDSTSQESNDGQTDQVEQHTPDNSTHSPTSHYTDNHAGLYILPPPPRQPARGKVLSKRVMASLFLLTLLLVFSGIFLVYYSTVTRPNQLHVQATATIKAITTHNAQVDATTQAQATSSAQAQANVVATALAQATVHAQATATAWQNLYTQSTSGIPAIDTPLSAQTGANWDNYDTNDGGGCAFTGGALHASVFTKDYYTPCLGQTTNFVNFAMEVQITFTKGDAGGILFRKDAQTNLFYAFGITHGNDYVLERRDKDSSMNILVSDQSSHIHSGSTNTLTIIARGATMYLYINKQYITSANDATLTSGEIGFFAEDRGNDTDVAFSNLRVWNL